VPFTKYVVGTYVAGRPATSTRSAARRPGDDLQRVVAAALAKATDLMIGYSINGCRTGRSSRTTAGTSRAGGHPGLKYRAFCSTWTPRGRDDRAQSGADSDSEALALAALPTPSDSKAVIGLRRRPLDGLHGAAGLDSYGTYYESMPSAFAPARVATPVAAASGPPAPGRLGPVRFPFRT